MAKLKSVAAKLTPEQKRHFDNLMAARDAVLGRIKHHAEDALDCSNADKRGVTTHMADMGSDNSRHEMELQLMSEEGDVLELIEDAIKRLLDGSGYGLCQDCGQPIPEPRLEVRPYAVYCTKCKSAREKNGSLRGR
mgnify:CR=1 FL=1